MIVVTQQMAVVPGEFVVDIKSRLVRWQRRCIQPSGPAEPASGMKHGEAG
ncbi:hypothetical protein QY049_03815 [Bradyrhizobium sp. WYCCWR 13022]|nr:hypothetical protein [Bradyrhizobium sp. WYCCWR 13022]MDN4982350.1 hypothetical protein [Bradyrhizobium sp. WYCCWR 13022]